MEKYKSKKEIELLFKNLSIRHIISNGIIYPELKECNLRTSTYYMDNIDEFSNLEKKYGEQLKNHYYAPLYVKKADNGIGYGLFADKPMEKADLVGQYTGIVQVGAVTQDLPCKPWVAAPDYDDSTEDISTETEFAWDYPDEIPGLPPLEINAGKAGSILRFVNHSFHPNLRIEHAVIGNEWMIFFIADMKIESDTQLFCDYGDDYWSADFREVVIP